MNIDPGIYESKYHVSCNAGGTYTIDFTDNILTLNRDGKLPLGEPMDESNCYCGFDPTKENKVVNPCKYGYIQFNPENVREVNIVSREYRKQINYRLMLSANTSYSGVPLEFRKVRYTNNVSPITNMENDTVQYKLLCDSAMGYLNFKEIYSIVDKTYPVTDIDYDKLIICPVFHIFVVNFTYTGDVITGASATTSYRRFYGDVKPEDKTAAGIYYDEDLWNNGFKDEFDENDRLIRRTIVEVAYCTIRYGKSNRQAFNYGNFADSAWNYDGDRVLPNNNRTWYALCPMIEYVDDITGSIFYSDIPGLQFPRQDNYSWTNRQELFNFTTTTYKTLNNFGRNTMMNITNSFGYECVVLNNDSNKVEQSFTALTWFSTNYQNDFTGHTGNEYIPLEDGSIISANAQNGITLIAKAYPIKDLMASVASLGFLIAADQTTAQTVDLDTFPNTMYRGNMTSDGITDGTWVQGEDIEDVPKISEVDYKPLTPGGGGEDTEDNTESGDKVPNQFGRSVGVTSNFITNYLMTEGQISKLGEVLWTSWADDAVTMDMVNNFYGKFHDATGSWNVSDALQFIVSCRLFPCSLATLVNTTQVSSIPIGTGAFALQCGTQSEPNFFIANEATAILNCGEVEIRREYNDYRDFENTKITAYLPFCGSVELNPQDVVGKWLGCTYAIDLFDGSCKAFIYTLSGNDVGYEGAYYNVAIKQGQCGFLIPMSATQAGQVASRQKVDGYTDGALLYQAAAGLMESAMALGGYSDANPVAGFNKMITAGTASSVLTAQRLGRAGISAPSTSGGSGFTDFHQPASAYVQIRRSYYQEPLQYEHSIGYPTNGAIYDSLSQFIGFIKCVNVDLSGFTCHEDERSEIKALLESGVYL